MATRIEVLMADITKMPQVEAIVNAAKETLLGGGGVDGAIHRAAGPKLLEECRTLHGCRPGEAKLTGAYRLPCRYVIHTVGPRWHGGCDHEAVILGNAYRNSLMVAASRGIRSIAFPSISTGVFGYPVELAAEVAAEAVVGFVKENPEAFDVICWAMRSEENVRLYRAAVEKFRFGDVYRNGIEAEDEEMDTPWIVGFHLPEESYGCFSNWYPAEFDYAGIHYSNSEQFMMYQKLMYGGRYDLAEKVMKTSDPARVKELAGKKYYTDYVSAGRDKVWERVRRHVVKNGVRAKFLQNPEMRKELMATGDAILAECSGKDTVWGIGINLHDERWMDTREWQGKNYLGRILMELREEFGRDLAVTGDSEYVDHQDDGPIRVWMHMAGDVRRIPQYHDAIHAYADQLSGEDREAFYGYPLSVVENMMRENMGGGLPIAGFYEMKQEVYEIAMRLERERR